MNPKKSRIKDIAQMSGVSIGTVDRVLHNRGEVSEKTRKKVMEVARDLNYTPNLLAQALKTKRLYNLVSFLPEPNEENLFWLKHPEGMVKAIGELDPFPVNLTQITFELQKEEDFQRKAEKILNLKPDGVLLAPIHKSQAINLCNNLKNRNIPFVFIDGYLAETSFLSYTGENVFQSGRVAGQLTEMISPSKSGILIVNIARNLQNVHHLSNRTNGFLSYFPGWETTNSHEIVSVNIPDTSRSKIKKMLSESFKKHPGIKSVFVTGSKSFMIADFIKDEVMNDVHIIGYDLLEANIEFLKSGIIKFHIGLQGGKKTFRVYIHGENT
jgi:LacI family transcriptional regulator